MTNSLITSIIELSGEVTEVTVPEGLSMSFVKVQPARPEGRPFIVSGAKAEAVRWLIFADQGLTRKQIAELATCSVSRVGEVVWGLEHDGVDFPAIPTK